MNSTHNNASLTPSREYFESGLREYIRCDVYHDTNELDFIVRWGMLLYDRNAGLVQEIKSLGLDQGGRQDYWKYPLLYGVQIDIGFVRFMVQLMEQQGITKTAILTDFSLRDRGGRGALACAMDSQQEEVVDFLLDEWKKKQVGNLNQFHRRSFNGRTYFRQILGTLGNRFALMSEMEQCVWYFSIRYLGAPHLQASTPDGSQGYPQLASQAATFLEKDDRFFKDFLRLQGNRSWPSHLWELYGHHLDYFDELVELEVATVVEDFLPFRFFQAPQRRRQYMRELSEREQEYPGSKLRTVVDFLFRVHEDWDEFNRCWQSAGGRHWTNGGFDDNAHIFPFQKGLKYLVTGLYENALQDESLKAYQFMSNLPIELDNEYPQPDVEDEYQHESFGVRYLLAPAGSGKTHMMFNALKKNLGFYLVSGAAQAAQMNLSPPADQLNGEQYFCPNAMGASADTRLLFEIVQLDHNIVNKGLSPFSLSEMHWRALQENRLRFLFEVVKQAQKNRTSVQPWRWLYFQLSCGINADPFLRLYRILALREGIHYKGQNHLPMSNIRAQAQKFLPKILWCFDEVQYEASTTLPSLPPAGCEGFMLVSFMVSWFRLGESNSAILGGTALNQKMIESKLAEARLDGVIDRRTEASRGHLNAEILTTDFDFFDGVIREATPFGQSRLLNDDETFRILLRATVVSIFNVLWVAVGEQGSTYRRMTSALLGVEAISENSSFIRKFGLQRTGHGIFVGLDRAQAVAKMLRGFEDLHGQIIRHSIPFRGRFRWSVCYIVTLLEIFIEYGYLTEMLTRHVSESVQQTLREPLVRRISLLASTKKDLAEHIFEMALQADLFGRSRILDDDNAAVLIEQAIGSIENISNSKGKKTFQVYLSERLVVEAVIQYLRNGNLLEDRALTYLRRCQYNASEMGFYAEEYLPRLMHAKTLPQRREFLTAFDTVYTISPTSALIPEQLGLEGYSLESVPGKISLEQSGDKDVHTWLREVCDNTPRATFLLPSTFAGPDVMFVVCKEVQGRKKRLICAVQLKTGLKIDIDERVQATIDPDQWYKKATEKRRNLLLELDNCKRQTEQDIGFIGVIFVAGNESSNVEKLAIANELWTHKRSTDFVDVVKTYKSGAESRSNEAKQKLQEPRTKKNVWQSKLQQAEMELVRWKNIERTTYFLKILSDDKVEEVFGSVFNRLLRGRHGK